MRKFRTIIAVAALAGVALLVPSTAHADAPEKADKGSAVQLIFVWKG
jgi:hypothetical protein